MGKIMKDEKRTVRNEHFIKAFEYVAKMKELNQAQLAKAINSQTSTISKYKNGLRPVTEETMDALIRFSVTIEGGGGQIYRPYLLGDSDYMLLRNVPEDEIVEVERRRDNPDYEVMQKRRKRREEETIPSWADSLIALVSDNTKTIESLRKENAALLKEVSDLRAIIISLRSDLRPTHAPVIYDEKQAPLPIAAENMNL